MIYLLKKLSKEIPIVRLKGGDPFVFGRGGEEITALTENGIPFDTVPGITSAIAIPAEAGIPVTHRGLSRSFHVITGPYIGQRYFGRYGNIGKTSRNFDFSYGSFKYRKYM